MTKEQENDIEDILASRSWLWVIPKEPSCLTDEVLIKIIGNPERALRALKQIQINDYKDYEDFWGSVWATDRKTKSNKSKKWRLIGSSRNKKWRLIGFSKRKKKD